MPSIQIQKKYIMAQQFKELILAINTDCGEMFYLFQTDRHGNMKLH